MIGLMMTRINRGTFIVILKCIGPRALILKHGRCHSLYSGGMPFDRMSLWNIVLMQSIRTMVLSVTRWIFNDPIQGKVLGDSATARTGALSLPGVARNRECYSQR